MEAGARLGRIDGLGSFRFGYTYQDLDRDAVMTAFNGDDWYLHSWYRGHLVRAGVGLGRGFAVQGTCVKDEKGHKKGTHSSLDTNRDGVISRAEWTHDRAKFDHLDTNRGGVLSSAERNGRKMNKRHHGMDKNKDGVITRGEWRGNDQSFRQHDKNGDGILSGVELRTGKKKR